MTDLTSLTLADAREGLTQKSFTALELTDAHLAAMEKARVLNAYVLETPEQARAQARAADATIAKGGAGPLAGIPLGIKDLFATTGVRATACSKILGNFIPQYESTVTSQLWRDGAGDAGQAQRDEFAMGSSNETSAFGPVINPWRRHYQAVDARPPDADNAKVGRIEFPELDDAKLVPGGSSGGSASAGGGQSVSRSHRHRHRRLDPPAGGVYRHCRYQADLWPLLALGHRGVRVVARSGRPFARTVRDTAILMRSMAGHDPKDTTSVDRPVPDYEAAIGKSVKGMKIGIPKEYRLDGMSGEIDKLWAQGARLAEGRGRRTGRGLAASHEVCAAGLLRGRAC